jgi:hypothetical protein
VPRALRPAIPLSELVLGASLITGLARPWTALATMAVLVAFSAAIALNLARGRAVPCGCVGDVSSRPVGPADLVRNAGLICLAAVAAGPPHPVAVVAFGAAALGAGTWIGLEVVTASRRRQPPSRGRHTYGRG